MSVTIKDLYKQKSEIDHVNFNSKECHERLKIARGYYATFLSAKNLLESDDSLIIIDYPPKSINPDKDKYGSHQKIAWSLIYSEVKALAEVGQKLATYHQLRKKADYDIHLDLTDDDIRNAEDLIKFCQERIEHYNKHGKQHFTTSKKVINATKTGQGIRVMNHRGLKVLKNN